MMPSPNIVIVLLMASVLGGLVLVQWTQRRATLMRLRAAMGETMDANASLGAAGLALKWLGSHLPGASDNSLTALLTSAGLFQQAALPIFVALRLIFTAAIFFLVLLGQPAIDAGTLLLAGFLAFFTSRLFVILLKLRAEARHSGIRRELPPLVDALLMVLNSGVSIDQCLRYVTAMLEHTAPLSKVVFKRYIAEIDSGLSYEVAFERLGQRLGIDEGYDLANLIKQALLHGGEIMTALERFGAELAEKRVNRAREQIGRKAVLLTLIMLVFFMPVLLVTLGGPAVSSITETLATVKQGLHDKGTRR